MLAGRAGQWNPTKSVIEVVSAFNGGVSVGNKRPQIAMSGKLLCALSAQRKNGARPLAEVEITRRYIGDQFVLPSN
jgi:hypothetical protein